MPSIAITTLRIQKQANMLLKNDWLVFFNKVKVHHANFTSS